MLKIERITYYRLNHQRLFYVAQNKILVGVTAHVYTPVSAMLEVKFKHLEFELWDLEYWFKVHGKYCFIIFEDGLKSMVLIVSIEVE